MKSNKPVSAEKAAAIEASKKRKEALREVAKTIAKLTEDQKRELTKNINVANVEGKSLSLNNTCLLISQNPTVTIVGGFKQWMKQGRCVKKGEKALYIWFPVQKKDKDGKPVFVAATEDPLSPFFLLGAVFDIAQTQETDDTNESPEAVEA